MEKETIAIILYAMCYISVMTLLILSYIRDKRDELFYTLRLVAVMFHIAFIICYLKETFFC